LIDPGNVWGVVPGFMTVFWNQPIRQFRDSHPRSCARF
jgi:hypothetical protein